METQKRRITDHIVPGDPASNQVSIGVMDEPTQGGACHRYQIRWRRPEGPGACNIHFQEGPIKEFGLNGITNEALLAIVIDRLVCFQGGPFASPANHSALADCKSALTWLQERARERIARGVEGTSAK